MVLIPVGDGQCVGGSNAKKRRGEDTILAAYSTSVQNTRNACALYICTDYLQRRLSTAEKRGVAFFAGVDLHRMA